MEISLLCYGAPGEHKRPTMTFKKNQVKLMYNRRCELFLSKDAVLKWLESPCVYHLKRDELFELDSESFEFFKRCAAESGCSVRDGALIDYCLEKGLVTEGRTSIRRPPLVKSPSPSLRYLELQITNACNLRCKHCYIGEEIPRELPVQGIRSALREFEEMQGLRVLVTGGEPLLHTNFGEVNDMLPDFSVRKVLFTNALLIKKDILKSLNVEEIRVSIDGLEIAHDALRGAGTFARSMDAVRRALDAGFEVSVATMVHSGNLGDFDDMERLFRSLGIKDWTVDVPSAAGRLKDNREFLLNPEQGGKYLAYGYGSGMHMSARGYACGLHLMAVLADGKTAKCAFYADQAVGTVGQGLRAAWQRVKPARLEELMCACEYIDICRGGCRYRAEIADGKKGRDPYRCALYSIFNKAA